MNSNLREQAIRVAQELVRVPSEAPPGNEQKVAEKIARLLSEGGLKVQLMPVATGRPNVIAIARGNAPGPTLLYHGHLDVVPAGELSFWHFKPYDGVICNGKLYGRGAADMKGGLAAMASAAMQLKKDNVPLRGNLVLAFTVDEEVTNLGTKKLIAERFRADWAIVGEPTNLEIALGHRGVVALRIQLTGRASHAAQSEKGINAIDKALNLMNELQRFKKTISMRCHPLLGCSSLNVTTIRGGTKVNIIPDTCELMIDRRLIPGETKESVEAEITTVLSMLGAADPEFQAVLTTTTYCPPGAIAADHPLVEALSTAAYDVIGAWPSRKGFEATCEASLLMQELGIPTVIFGPGRIDQAHNADEYVETAQIGIAAEVYYRLALRLLAGQA